MNAFLKSILLSFILCTIGYAASDRMDFGNEHRERDTLLTEKNHRQAEKQFELMACAFRSRCLPNEITGEIPDKMLLDAFNSETNRIIPSSDQKIGDFIKTGFDFIKSKDYERALKNLENAANLLEQKASQANDSKYYLRAGNYYAFCAAISRFETSDNYAGRAYKEKGIELHERSSILEYRNNENKRLELFEQFGLTEDGAFSTAALSLWDFWYNR
ncbi:MAG: hypothetical protein NTX76_06345 [Alphaproteobacteria bacterium]|nr:hypothetical protein [Alphaproteobacteria bacterium]